ncbi:MAG: GNAT family N-acetyltransferase [Winogradskyella sp.]|uniref:GNAT family N-acetyltransferase n=1 Tax=Winogradskyella poriferorum TaxID=307627 RepID=A0ABU7W8Z4_9FLAO|nr:GNAT family N-acetyltransferase [Winogradskyella sp.]|tara:strand:+ start:1666 stop:2643 length:978 start_codon:yes stop_codon:yes gene_type:complete
MQQFDIKLYQSTLKENWNTFLLESNQQTFLFQRGFMDYHSDRFQDFSLMIYNNGELTALLPANKVDHEIYSHQGLTYGGLIYKPNLKSKEVISILKSVLEYLSENGIKTLMIKELPFVFLDNQTNNPLAYLCFKLKAQLQRMDLHSTLELKFKRYNRSRKNGYKRGLKNNLTVRETDEFKSFWNEILIPNLDNKHDVKPVHSLDEIQLLKSRFPKQIRQFNVYHNDTIVAGTTIFETKYVAHSQYISGNEDKNTLGSLDFLHHYLLEEVFADKKYFNFGISNENNGQNINEGLQYWKEGYGAHSITQGFYKIETSKYKHLEDIYV